MEAVRIPGEPCMGFLTGIYLVEILGERCLATLTRLSDYLYNGSFGANISNRK
jgi:hypothetical protein